MNEIHRLYYILLLPIIFAEKKNKTYNNEPYVSK